MEKDPCLNCDCWGPDAEGCTMPETDRSFACPLYDNTLRAAVQRVSDAIKELADAILNAFREVAKKVFDCLKDFMNSIMHNCTDHPRWWHYYKHAKKWRTRKKYKHLLQRELIQKIRKAVDPNGG